MALGHSHQCGMATKGMKPKKSGVGWVGGVGLGMASGVWWGGGGWGALCGGGVVHVGANGHQVIGGRQKQLMVLAMHAPHHAVHVCAPQPNKPSWPALAGPTWAGF